MSTESNNISSGLSSLLKTAYSKNVTVDDWNKLVTIVGNLGIEDLTSVLHIGAGTGENSVQQTQSSKNVSYANDYYSFEEAPTPGAIGKDSFEANGNSAALGELSFASGRGTATIAARSHTEGTNTIANGINSHAEGGGTYTGAEDAHAEGMYTKASGVASHSEGFRSQATGIRSHAEGQTTEASGGAAHSEGSNSVSSGFASHSEGSGTIASGNGSHSEGYSTTASGLASHTEGSSTSATETNSHAEGRATTASGANSHAEGQETESYGDNSHSEGYQTKTYGEFGHTEGWNTYVGKKDLTINRYNIDTVTPPPPTPLGTRYKLKDDIQTDNLALEGTFQIIGNDTVFHYIVSGNAGTINYQIGRWWGTGSIQVYKDGAWISPAYKTVYDQSTGSAVTDWLNANKAQGTSPVVSYNSAGHAEGVKTQAVGSCSHAEGQATLAMGSCSHAEGWLNEANGDYSHAEGKYTTANGYAQHVEGRYNQQRGDDVLHIVGNGTDKDHLSNAFEVFADGHAEVKASGSTPNSIVRKADVDTYIHKIVGSIRINDSISGDLYGTIIILNKSFTPLTSGLAVSSNYDNIISFNLQTDGGDGGYFLNTLPGRSNLMSARYIVIDSVTKL